MHERSILVQAHPPINGDLAQAPACAATKNKFASNSIRYVR